MRFFFFPIFWTKTITKILTTSLEALYYQECSNESESNAIPIIDIVAGGYYGQMKFQSVCKFILRDVYVKNLDSDIIKNAFE